MRNNNNLIIYIILFIISFFPSLSSSADRDVLSIRPYGELGETTVNASVNKQDKDNYSFGSAFYYGTINDYGLNMNIGLEIGYWRLYNVYADDLDQTTDYLKMFVVSDINYYFIGFADWLGLNFIFGAGPYIGLSDDEDTHLGLMFGGGLVFKFSESIQLMLMSQYDSIQIRKDRNIGNFTSRIALNFMFELN